MKLTQNEIHLIRLASRDADADGWSKVSGILWKFVEALPAELREMRPAETGGGHVRLTEAGNTVAMFL